MLESWSKCLCARNSDCSSCANRGAYFECNDTNCTAGSGSCRNRLFGELEKQDADNKLCVEVFDAGDKGYGLRTCRSFPAGHLLCEYSGDIMTREEYEHRTEDINEASSDDPNNSSSF